MPKKIILLTLICNLFISGDAVANMFDVENTIKINMHDDLESSIYDLEEDDDDNLTVMQSKTPDLAGSAQAAVLLDANSGRTLYEKNANTKLRIASLTKIMTAIIAIEESKDLDEIVTIQPSAVGVEGSSIYLKAGEQIPLRTLLYGMMLRSGNDAATAIAQHIGGSVDAFVMMMNNKAHELGLNHTHFINPTGLDTKTDSTFSTAADMAHLTAYALKNPTFKQIVSTKKIDVAWPGESAKRTFYNKNKLLSLDKDAIGVKTGFTEKARRTLIGATEKDGRQLVTVTLKSGKDDWQAHQNMFDYGFKSFETHVVLEKDEPLNLTDPSLQKIKQKYALVAGESFQFPFHDAEQLKRIKLHSVITYPYDLEPTPNTAIGTIRIYLDEEVIGSVALLTKESK